MKTVLFTVVYGTFLYNTTKPLRTYKTPRAECQHLGHSGKVTEDKFHKYQRVNFGRPPGSDYKKDR